MTLGDIEPGGDHDIRTGNCNGWQFKLQRPRVVQCQSILSRVID
jgi:hypothetical protein